MDHIIFWLTGYDAMSLQGQLEKNVTVEEFFLQAPAFHPAACRITGTICGHRVEDIPDPLMQKIRYLDKLVDELARGKAMDKILRQV